MATSLHSVSLNCDCPPSSCCLLCIPPRPTRPASMAEGGALQRAQEAAKAREYDKALELFTEVRLSEARGQCQACAVNRTGAEDVRRRPSTAGAFQSPPPTPRPSIALRSGPQPIANCGAIRAAGGSPLLALADAAHSCRRRLLPPLLHSQAVTADADSVPALVGRAGVYNKLKQHMEAAGDAARAVELDDRSAAALREKGCALARASSPALSCRRLPAPGLPIPAC